MPTPVITENLQNRLRAVFDANDVKAKTKTALKYEYFFMQGAYAGLQQEMPPALVMLMMSGRSILDRPVEQLDAPATVEGTQRHNFRTEEVRARLETASKEELIRMLDEALHVVDGLRANARTAIDAASNAVRIRDSQWLAEQGRAA